MTTDTGTAPSAHPTNPASTHSGTFDPEAWLADYTALGGCYTTTETTFNLCVVVNGQTCPELIEARDMADRLTQEERAAIFAHLSGERSPTWQDVVEKYEADRDVLTAHPYGRTLPGDPAYGALSNEADALTDKSERSLQALVAAPAPDHVALRRKIEIAGAEYGDGLDVFSHLLADMDRLARGNDSALLDAWKRRAEAFERYNALPFSDAPDAVYTPEETAEWATIDAAEEVLRSTVATTPAGVAVQLWTALGHMLTKGAHDDAARDRDLAAFDAIDAELDWSARMVLAALRSLTAQEA